uniref:Ovule protein n=1 Tax=Ascaris lumbricoides TaxID=6252 RepID=A0A0M3HSF0_ASCLU
MERYRKEFVFTISYKASTSGVMISPLRAAHSEDVNLNEANDTERAKKRSQQFCCLFDCCLLLRDQSESSGVYDCKFTEDGMASVESEVNSCSSS